MGILVIFVHSIYSSIFSILSAVYLSPGAMARLCLLALLVLSTIFNNSSANTLRAERDACEEKQEEEEETDNGEPAGSSEDPEKDGGDEEDSEDQVDAGSGDVNNDSADAEDTNGEEQS